MSMLSNIRRTYSRKGIDGICRKAIRFIRKLLWQRRDLLVAKRRLDIPMIKFRKLLDVSFRPILAEDTHLIGYVPESRKKRLWSKYFRNGDLCVAGMHDGRAVFHVFATFRPFRDTEIRYTVPVEPHQVYQFEGAADLAFRGKGVAVTIMEPFWNLMREHGKTETVAMFDLANKPACKFHKRLSFEPFIVVRSYILLRFFTFTSVRAWNPDADHY